MKQLPYRTVEPIKLLMMRCGNETTHELSGKMRIRTLPLPFDLMLLWMQRFMRDIRSNRSNLTSENVEKTWSTRGQISIKVMAMRIINQPTGIRSLLTHPQSPIQYKHIRRTSIRFWQEVLLLNPTYKTE
jgi:hypothetical protein